MKEARFISWVLIILFIIFLILDCILYHYSLSFGVDIISNIICGLLVGFITSLCQYFVCKNNIKYGVYNLYYDIFYTYYSIRKNKKFFHYDSLGFYKKIADNNVKISSLLEEYHGFFKKEDKLYKTLNPNIEYKGLGKIMKKSIFSWINVDSFYEGTVPIISAVESVLRLINNEKFEKDYKKSIVISEELFNK